MKHDFYVHNGVSIIVLIRDVDSDQVYEMVRTWKLEPGQVAGVYDHLESEQCKSLEHVFG